MFTRMEPDDRRAFIDEAAAQKEILSSAIEKDFWVCWILRILFNLPEFGQQFTFKGGTSLSKAYGLIERFSEDIDMTIHRSFLGFSDESDPGLAPSNKARQKALIHLQTACSSTVAEQILPLLNEVISNELEETFRIEIDPDDAQALLFYFPTVLDRTYFRYITPYVKIEFGARSDIWPQETREINSYLSDIFPDKIDESEKIQVRVLAPERTFWEKATILHAEHHRPSDKELPARLSRHYYDLSRLTIGGVAEKALSDSSLREAVVEHKQVFFRSGWARYELATPGGFRILPSPSRLDSLLSDYKSMSDMFFRTPPLFEDILEVLRDLESQLNIP